MLAEWLAAEQAPANVAWVSLDAEDKHPPTFWTYVLEALQRVMPELSGAAIAKLQSAQPPSIESLLPPVLNEIAGTGRSVTFVLDDYHVIDDSSIHEGVSFLLQHMPPEMHLVLASRSDPALPLARIRARGELTEVRAADLRFTAGEAASFLRETMGLQLSTDDVQALEARTEGWAAALQLAALSMEGRDDVAGFITAFSGNTRYMVDYLVEEVLHRQPGPMRRFLQDTCVLDRLNASLCDAVTGTCDGKEMLEALERQNLFVVPLDDERRWYRYHHLFAEMLKAQPREEGAPSASLLHRRASEWYESNGYAAEAIHSAMASNDLKRAAALIEMEAQPLNREHRPERLVRWLERIPDEVIHAMPVLCTYYALAWQGYGDIERSEAYMRVSEAWLNGERNPAEMVVAATADFESLPSRVALGRGYLSSAARDPERTMACGLRALELLPEDEHHWRGTGFALVGLARWMTGDLEGAEKVHADAGECFVAAGDIVLALNSAYAQGELLKARGRLVEAKRLYERSLRIAAEYGSAAYSGLASVHFGFCDLLCEQGELDLALGQLRAGEDCAGSEPLPRVIYRAHIARARVLRTEGDFDRALETLERATSLFRIGAVPDMYPVSVQKERVRLLMGNWRAVLDWARAQGLSIEDEPDFRREFEHLTFAHALIARALSDSEASRELDTIGGFLARLHDAAAAGGRNAAVIETFALRAIVQQALGDMHGAVELLASALRLAEPEGYWQILVERGEPMRELLRKAVKAGAGASYARRLLAAFDGPVESAQRAALTPNESLVEPLTPRELEILRLIADGMRNQEIADHLVISLPTVKRHIANAFGKMEVGHRTEAIVKANELGLI